MAGHSRLAHLLRPSLSAPAHYQCVSGDSSCSLPSLPFPRSVLPNPFLARVSSCLISRAVSSSPSPFAEPPSSLPSCARALSCCLSDASLFRRGALVVESRARDLEPACCPLVHSLRGLPLSLHVLWRRHSLLLHLTSFQAHSDADSTRVVVPLAPKTRNRKGKLS